jgi:hypothetical protein
MYSYYSRNDSVIINSPSTPIHSSDPVNFDYLISIQLDTVLMKDGFAFNYRFFAEDKGIITEYSNSPDSGYYQCVWDETTHIEDENNSSINFSLSQNYPNPFNPVTKIKFTVPNVETRHALSVQLKVYDLLGREVVKLVNEEKPAGEYEIEFDGTGLPSGIYFYQIRAGDPSADSGQSFVETKKMALLR